MGKIVERKGHRWRRPGRVDHLQGPDCLEVQETTNVCGTEELILIYQYSVLRNTQLSSLSPFNWFLSSIYRVQYQRDNCVAMLEQGFSNSHEQNLSWRQASSLERTFELVMGQETTM